jgi:proton-translocating NADH-quinone oxidoreductase chain N
MKESKEGTEAGMKYFIVGSVASGVGLYGLSLLYLWSGSLQFSELEAAFATNGMESLPLIALGMLLVGFGFKVSAAPFHFAAPDAYAGATAPVAGVLATASKAMGVLGLLRVLLVVASPEATEGAAVWLVALGVLSVVTMTWGNIAALGSTNPKRMLAYSSVAHAGYMMAAITAIGALNWEDGHVNLSNDAALVVVTALIFHLTVLVCFKLGAFLVLSLLESEKGGHTLESLGGLAKREPFLAVAMFIFMMSLAGVPPLSGFVSKLLVIMGIVKVALLDVTVNSDLTFADIHWVWYLALAMVINSAISVFYYLRVGLVMYFHDPEEGREGPLPSGRPVRLAILACLVTTVFFGVGAGQLIALCESAANALVGAW